MTPALRHAALAAVLALAACAPAAPPAALAPPERPPAPVAVTAAIARDVPVYVDEIGRAVATETVAVRPQVGGRVTEIRFADGADVKAGDVLFTIDPRPFAARVAAAEAALAQRRAVRDLARTELARAERLAETKALSQAERDARRSDVAVGEADAKEAEAALETARIDLDWCSVRAPIDGRAGRRLVDLGNVVEANGRELVVLQRLDPVYAEFSLAERQLGVVQRHMRDGTLKAEVRLPEEPGDAREGELTFLDNAVEPGSGTVMLRATVPNADRRFWPGRFVRVRLVLGTRPAAVLVPAVAPQTSAEGSYVYVAKPEGVAELRPVTLGQRQGDLVVVEKGLQAGERVVVAGQILVTPGGKIAVREEDVAALPRAGDAR